ncbi:hypothetical protein QL189_02535 [Cronobacter turicensis]|uniref:hypothetical protein n=1 Tax=Cronobacter turicensis TaxID=413502 RepID=UPI001DF0E333|nr:hypothetical protein [Cronobacter turicensis]EGT4494320.1 hypothetical protein [Cronobacter turicensis]ELY4323659.1 hypothetical protein [Cronobacter turicensis]MDI6416266.1 hypothetical protein [Cronobacter turicensis]MDI6463022.1 hypothetical protein [Cronobacter turicensis]MDI7674470.1 hypothetical protein [Cronobacter turicensis]
MTLDIRGGRKNTAANRSDYVVFEEMLSNAIDSYLIRKNENPEAPSFKVKFSIELHSSDLLGDTNDLVISCSDNGAGFGDDQVKAFITKDSTYKDDLKIKGIGQCKGAGRIQFFHQFDSLSLDSVYFDNAEKYRRQLNIDSSTKEISENSFRKDLSNATELFTTIKLKNKRDLIQKTNQDMIIDVFSSDAVSRHLYRSFLQRFVILKDLIGNFSIEIEDNFSAEHCQREINSDHLPKPCDIKTVPLICTHEKTKKTAYELKLTRYSFPSIEFAEFHNEIALCANSAAVYSLTKFFIKNPFDRKRPITDNYELILVESEFLESRVNIQRDGFEIPYECGHTDDILEGFSIQDIIESIEDFIFSIITPDDFDKNALIQATQEKFGITPSMLEAVNVKIHYSDTSDNIAKRVLKKYQDEIVKDTSNFIDIKQHLLTLDPRTSDFRDKVNELSWRYTKTIKKVDMANLSQLIVRRSAMIEVLRKAVSLLLDCQQEEQGKRNQNEKIIHNIFFPMGKDESVAKDHDIWLLNEEYQYFEHISSDKPLSSLTWLDGGNIFENDIDESLEKLFAENNENHSAKRPDIAVFSQENSVIIIEFKAPGVPIQDHINDLAQYSRLLAAKSGGKIKKFYGYLIGTTLDHSRMPTGWNRFANGEGYFQTGPIEDPETGRRYGELYSELLFYNNFISRAEKRLEVYKRKLNFEL